MVESNDKFPEQNSLEKIEEKLDKISISLDKINDKMENIMIGDSVLHTKSRDEDHKKTN